VGEVRQLTFAFFTGGSMKFSRDCCAHVILRGKDGDLSIDDDHKYI
jgi:hypothetical protein